MGTRQNAQNLNINRDFMKLDTPEGQAFVKLWNDYDPHVGFDLHTSDGSYHGYYLTYSPPLNPATSDAIMTTMKDEWFPFVTKSVKAKHGWDTYYYGNALGRRTGHRRRTPRRRRRADVQSTRDADAGRRRVAGTRVPPRRRIRCGRGARSSTCPASTTTTSACATASRC